MLDHFKLEDKARQIAEIEEAATASDDSGLDFWNLWREITSEPCDHHVIAKNAEKRLMRLPVLKKTPCVNSFLAD